jgi:predicted SAM-dependent methyltransferase
MHYPVDDLAARVAALHHQRRQYLESVPPKVARRTVSDLFIRGNGIEAGAGARPFPIPSGAKCFYGDIRDGEQLKTYFKVDEVSIDGAIDAQTYAGIEDNSLDFVISAHVIEHLENPLGSIENAIRVLKPGGIHLLAVPDLRFNFDRHRQPTSLNHLIEDAADGGAGSRINDYIEFLRDVARPEWGNQTPDEELERVAVEMSERNQDIHFHSWTTETFRDLLSYACLDGSFRIIGSAFVINENIFVLEKNRDV